MKTLVIGLDGVDDDFWKIGDIGLQVNYHGELETFYSTFPSFLCSLTGKRYDSIMQVDFSSHRIGHKMLWDYLGDIRQTYINIPATYPAEEVNGSFICGWKARELNSNSVRPTSLLAELSEIGYYFGEDLFEKPIIEGRWHDFIELAIDQIHMRTKVIKHLAKRDDPELLFAVYTATDECLHQRRKGRLGEKRIKIMNKILVEDISSIIEETQPETLIFFSDHSVNLEGYHGPDHPETKWGTWALRSNLEHIPPRDKAHILDILPTILASLDVKYQTLEGCPLLTSKSDTDAYLNKLRRLGYID